MNAHWLSGAGSRPREAELPHAGFMKNVCMSCAPTAPGVSLGVYCSPCPAALAQTPRRFAGVMVSGRAFQQILDIIRGWWLCGLRVNGQCALTDDASKCEAQQRGTVHLHALFWQSWPVPYVWLTRVSALPPDMFAYERQEGDAVEVD